MRLALLLLLALAFAPRAARTPEENFYLERIKPVLAARCFACHGVLKQESGLRLDAIATIQKGGDSGPIIVPDQVDESPLVERITAGEEERMPPEGEPLKPAEIEAIRSWIAAGRQAPADEQPEPDPRDHWAFQTPLRPAVPAVGRPGLGQEPDRRLHRRRASSERGLTPQPPADKRVWLRRVSLDLIGLPPTPRGARRVPRRRLGRGLREGRRPAARQPAVRRALGPALDGHLALQRLVGARGRGPQLPEAHLALARLDRRVAQRRQGLRPDAPRDARGRRAVSRRPRPAAGHRLPGPAVLQVQPHDLARRDGRAHRKAFLGLTLNCAKCHDHKYDPISQVDYYRLRAFFEPYQVRTDMVPGETDLEKDGIPRAFDCNLDAPTFLHIRGDERNPDESRVIEPGVPGVPGARRELKIEPVTLPVEAYQPGLRPFVARSASDGRRSGASAEVAQRPETAASKLAEAEPVGRGCAADRSGERWPSSVAEKAARRGGGSAPRRCAAASRRRSRSAPATASRRLRPRLIAATRPAPERVAAGAKADEDASPRRTGPCSQAAAEKKAEAEKKLRGREGRRSRRRARRSSTPGESYTPLLGALKTLESNLETEESRSKPFPKTSTGRRSALARWITDPKHPLTARVAVNHIWSRHFGRPLVPTVFDFGRKGTPPTHPELLDWLAVELVEHGWSMKHIHRLIVTSNTYRLSSSSAGAAAETLAADPENRFYWRANPIRMEAQARPRQPAAPGGRARPDPRRPVDPGRPTRPRGGAACTSSIRTTSIRSSSRCSTTPASSNATAARRASCRSRPSPWRTARWRPSTAEKIARRDRWPPIRRASDRDFIRAAFLTRPVRRAVRSRAGRGPGSGAGPT